MVRIIMVGNRKGGVCKTTTTVNLAYELMKLDQRVLIADFDGQANATSVYSCGDETYYVGDALLDRKFDIRKAIYPAIVDGEPQEKLHILPGRSGDVMTKLDMDMISLARREERLKNHLELVQNDYDFILIDTNPGTSVLGLNAVIAASEYIIPTTYREKSFEGIEMLIKHIEDVKFIDEDDIKFTILRCNLSRAAKRELEYGKARIETIWKDRIAKTVVWNRVVFGDAELASLPVSKFAPSHAASAYYRDFAREIVRNGK